MERILPGADGQVASRTVNRTDPGTWLELTRRALDRALLLDLLTRFLVPWLYLAAVALLLLKATGLPTWLRTAHILLTALPVLAVASWRASRQRYTRLETAAWLDLEGRAGGAWIQVALEPEVLRSAHARLEGEVGGSAPGRREPEVLSAVHGQLDRIRPALRWRSTLRILFPPLLFLLVSLAVPRTAPSTADQASPFASRAATLQSHIEQARQLEALSPETARQLELSLQRALEDAGTTAEVTAEALDEVQKRLEQGVLEQVGVEQAAIRAAQRLGAVSQAASGAALPGSGPEGGRSEESGPALATALDQALKGLPPLSALSPELSAQLAGLPGVGPAGRDRGEALKEALKDATGRLDPANLRSLAGMLERAHEGRLTRMQGAAAFFADSRSKELLMADAAPQAGTGQRGDTAEGGDGQSSHGSAPDMGSASQGGGKTPLTFNLEPAEAAGRFKAVPFRPGKDALPGALIGQRLLAPGLEPSSHSAAPRNQGKPASPDGGADPGARLGPYHRSVAVRYFTEDTH